MCLQGIFLSGKFPEYILRGYFSQDKAKDAARLAPCKDDNAVLRKIDREDCLLFIRY